MKVRRKYLKGELLSVVEEHKDGHLKGGHLENVLPGVGARHLSAAHAHVRAVLLAKERKRIRSHIKNAIIFSHHHASCKRKAVDNLR